MRSLVSITGIMMTILGVWCFLNEGVSFKAFAFPIGAGMLITGVIESMMHLSVRNKIENMAWLLSESFIMAVLGVIVLLNFVATESMAMVFFGLWMIAVGCIRVVGGMALRDYHDNAWKWTLGWGVLSLLIGIYHFANYTFFNISLGILIGIDFCLQGVNVLSLGVSMPHIKKNRKRIERS